MYWYFLIYSLLFEFVWSEPFFNLSEKPIFFCFKVCPLYCSPRRSDEDAASLIYLEDDPYSETFEHDVWIDDDPSYIPFSGHFELWKPKPKPTTTPAPTTTTMAPTTEEPTFICILCKKKCGSLKS